VVIVPMRCLAVVAVDATVMAPGPRTRHNRRGRWSDATRIARAGRARAPSAPLRPSGRYQVTADSRPRLSTLVMGTRRERTYRRRHRRINSRGVEMNFLVHSGTPRARVRCGPARSALGITHRRYARLSRGPTPPSTASCWRTSPATGVPATRRGSRRGCRPEARRVRPLPALRVRATISARWGRRVALPFVARRAAVVSDRRRVVIPLQRESSRSRVPGAFVPGAARKREGLRPSDRGAREGPGGWLL
jgi:hypothetical protein